MRNAKQLLIDYKDRQEKAQNLAEKYIVLLEYEQKERAKELEHEISIVSHEMQYIAKEFIEQFII